MNINAAIDIYGWKSTKSFRIEMISTKSLFKFSIFFVTSQMVISFRYEFSVLCVYVACLMENKLFVQLNIHIISNKVS